MGAAPEGLWRKLAIDLNVDTLHIDLLLNPFTPRNRLDVLPAQVSHWLGYREGETTDARAIIRLPLIFLATLAGLCLVGGIYNNAPGILDWNPPILIASLGASAILDYNVIRSPLSQPRNVIVGHTLAAIVGVGVSKLFQLNPNFHNIQWVAGAVGCACSSIVMSLANVIHPPGGATAVLASADAQVVALGWRFVPLILLASCLMTTVACIFNNIARHYPLYWWTPEETGWLLPHSALRGKRKGSGDDKSTDVEKALAGGKSGNSDQDSVSSGDTLHDARTSLPGSSQYSLRSQLPVDMELSVEELSVLQRLDERLQTHASSTARP